MIDYITAEERVGEVENTDPWWMTAIYLVVLYGLIYYCLWTIGGY